MKVGCRKNEKILRALSVGVLVQLRHFRHGESELACVSAVVAKVLWLGQFGVPPCVVLLMLLYFEKRGR